MTSFLGKSLKPVTIPLLAGTMVKKMERELKET
jgi:hypothetical protein